MLRLQRSYADTGVVESYLLPEVKIYSDIITMFQYCVNQISCLTKDPILNSLLINQPNCN